MENRDGEGYEGASVDEGRCQHVEDPHAPESDNDGDCAQTEAERGSDVSEGNQTSCDVREVERREGLESPADVNWEELMQTAEISSRDTELRGISAGRR
jgi:hypothetical protein